MTLEAQLQSSFGAQLATYLNWTLIAVDRPLLYPLSFKVTPGLCEVYGSGGIIPLIDKLHFTIKALLKQNRGGLNDISDYKSTIEAFFIGSFTPPAPSPSNPYQWLSTQILYFEPVAKDSELVYVPVVAHAVIHYRIP